MNKGLKITLLVGGLAVVFGTIITVTAFLIMGGNIENISKGDYEMIEYKVEDVFNKIEVNALDANVNIFYVENDECKVVCAENEYVKHLVSVSDEKLSISREIKKNILYYTDLFSNSKIINVFLPANSYSELDIKSNSGTIKITDHFEFNQVILNSKSGNIAISDINVNDDLSITAESGSIKVESINAKSISLKSRSGSLSLSKLDVINSLKLNTESGVVKVSNSNSSNITISTTSGSIKLIDVEVKEKLTLTSRSGAVNLENSDAKDLNIKTSSGSVVGTLKTSKIFITTSSSGTIDVPKTTVGGVCEVETKSGNIKFSIVE